MILCGAIVILNLRAFHRVSCGFTHRFHVHVHLHGHFIVSIMIAATASFHKLIFVAILLQLNHVDGSTDAAGSRLLLVNILISSLFLRFFPLSPHFVSCLYIVFCSIFFVSSLFLADCIRFVHSVIFSYIHRFFSLVFRSKINRITNCEKPKNAGYERILNDCLREFNEWSTSSTGLISDNQNTLKPFNHKFTPIYTRAKCSA